MAGGTSTTTIPSGSKASGRREWRERKPSSSRLSTGRGPAAVPAAKPTLSELLRQRSEAERDKCLAEQRHHELTVAIRRREVARGKAPSDRDDNAVRSKGNARRRKQKKRKQKSSLSDREHLMTMTPEIAGDLARIQGKVVSYLDMEGKKCVALPRVLSRAVQAGGPDLGRSQYRRPTSDPDRDPSREDRHHLSSRPDHASKIAPKRLVLTKFEDGSSSSTGQRVPTSVNLYFA